MFNRTKLNINIFQSIINTTEVIVMNESNSLIGFSFEIGENNNLSRFFKITAKNWEFSDNNFNEISSIESTPCNNLINRYSYNKSLGDAN